MALSLPRTPTGRPGPARAATFVCGTAALVVASRVAAHVPDATLVPATAVLALASAIALTIAGLRTRALASPLILIGVPLLLSLAAAMQPLTRIFGAWSVGSLSVALMIVIAPLAGIAVAMLATHGGTPALERGTRAEPYPTRLVAVCLAMCAAGTAVYLYEWSRVGGPPLFSSSIDKARFGYSYGLVYVFTEGLPLALLIAAWARAGRAECFTALQRRTLEGIMCFVPIVLALGGGRALVLVPLLTALVVSGRYLSRRTARRLIISIPVAVLVFSSAVFLARVGQNSPTGAVGTVLYNDNGAKTSPVVSAYRALTINLGEELRVVLELRASGVHTPPFTTSIWFAHNFFPRAIDPQTITGPNAGGWLTATYAGPLLIDLGLLPALLFGFVLGAAAHLLYRSFARGRSVTIIWVYSYLAGAIAFAFYVNLFLQFLYPMFDLVVLIALSRLLIAPEVAPAGRRAREWPPVPRVMARDPALDRGAPRTR